MYETMHSYLPEMRHWNGISANVICPNNKVNNLIIYENT